MKKFGLILLMSAVMLVCVLPITASAFIPIPRYASTVSSGNIWIIVGILLIAIIVAVIIIKKVKAKNKNDK